MAEALVTLASIGDGAALELFELELQLYLLDQLGEKFGLPIIA